jgi:hypothetical protein
MQFKYSLFKLILIFFTSISVSKAQNLNLTSLKDWKIVLADTAIASEKFAALEFQSLFEKALGKKFDIVNNSIDKSKNIFIGLSGAMQKTDGNFTIDDLGLEGLRIKTTSDNIIIAGGRPRGTLYGVYEFAEKYLGIRFLAKDYTYVPPVPDKLLLPVGEFSYKPPFVYRSVYYRENMDHPDFSVKLRNNAFASDAKFGGTCDMQFIVHSFFRQCPVDKYGKGHPEYFAEVGGKRLLEAYGGGPQIDVSNPDVIKIMTEAVLKEIAEHPEYKNVSVVHNDNEYYCHCPTCEAINSREESPMGAHLEMVNAIGDEVKKKYPDVKVGTLAYQYTRKPPKAIYPRDNVMVQLCSIECDLLHAYSDPENQMNKSFAEDLAGWGKICNNLWIWDYMVDYFLYGLPFPNLKSIGSNIKYYRDNHVKGVFMEANYNSVAGEMSDLKNYVASQCLWKPDLDSWELTKEFCSLYYKRSSKPILEYLTKIHERVEKENLKARFNARPSDIGLDEKFADWMMNKFDEAMILADDETIRNRVERASLCAYVAMIEGGRGQAVYDYGKVNFASSEKYKQALQAFPLLAKKHGITHYYEEGIANMPRIAEIFENELKVYAKGGRPAVHFKNKDWQVTLLNEENAKCIELRNMQSGINLLSADKTDLSNGFFKEYILKGKDIKDTVKFTPTLKKNELKLEGILKDGSLYERWLVFTDDGSGKIHCRSTITNKTAHEKTVQIKVDFYANTGFRERNEKILNASVKHQGKLKQFNAGMIGQHGPHEKLIDEGKEGGQFMLFNNLLKSGVLETFNARQTDALDASWTDDGSFMNLGIKSKEFMLKPGESCSFDYEFTYLNSPLSE